MLILGLVSKEFTREMLKTPSFKILGNRERFEDGRVA